MFFNVHGRSWYKSVTKRPFPTCSIAKPLLPARRSKKRLNASGLCKFGAAASARCIHDHVTPACPVNVATEIAFDSCKSPTTIEQDRLKFVTVVGKLASVEYGSMVELESQIKKERNRNPEFVHSENFFQLSLWNVI